MLDIDYWIAGNDSNEVRWRKVEDLKRILATGTYPVSPHQLAAKLLEHMLELSARRRLKLSRSSIKAEKAPVLATIPCGENETDEMSTNARSRAGPHAL